LKVHVFFIISVEKREWRRKNFYVML